MWPALVASPPLEVGPPSLEAAAAATPRPPPTPTRGESAVRGDGVRGEPAGLWPMAYGAP
eukprot:3920625-Prymnesium_polylepis.1